MISCPFMIDVPQPSGHPPHQTTKGTCHAWTTD